MAHSMSKGYSSPSYLRTAAAQLEELKRRSYSLLHVSEGQQVLDVGCGPGADTLALGRIVGAQGRVAGIDFDQGMVDEANRRAREADQGGWVFHQVADATSLPFEDATFDACRSERLFQHLLEPDTALAEMVRVTRSNGWVVALDTDWGTMSVDTREVDIERRVARVQAERALNNGYAGRQLYRLFREAGLAEVSVEMFPTPITSYGLARLLGQLDQIERVAIASGALTEGELDRWHADLEEAEAKGQFFGSVSLMAVAGQRR